MVILLRVNPATTATILIYLRSRSRSRVNPPVSDRLKASRKRRLLLGSPSWVDSVDISRGHVSHRDSRSRSGVVDGVGRVVSPVGSTRSTDLCATKV